MSSAAPRPLRVAIFGESYLPYLSGVTVATEALARGLGRAGHRVLLVAPRPAGGGAPPAAGSPGPDPDYAWLPSYQPPPPAPPGYRMPAPVPSAALRAVGEFAPDVIHAQSPFVSGLMARHAARRLRVPLVFTHHTRFGDYRHYLGPLAPAGGALASAYLRAFWAGCAAVIAPGSQLAAEIRARLGARSRPLVRSIPTGVDLAALSGLERRDPRPGQGWPADALVVVSVGRLAREKSVDLLVEAFAHAARRDERLRLLLIGRGPAEERLRDQAASPSLAGLVALPGELPRLDALALAGAADLFAFASRTETQGLVLAEALALGLPIVALDGPGVGDALRDGVDGVLVPADPPRAAPRRLGDAIGALAADPEWRAALASAARAGSVRFDVRARIDEVVAVYRAVVGQ